MPMRLRAKARTAMTTQNAASIPAKIAIAVSSLIEEELDMVFVPSLARREHEEVLVRQQIGLLHELVPRALHLGFHLVRRDPMLHRRAGR